MGSVLHGNVFAQEIQEQVKSELQKIKMSSRIDPKMAVITVGLDDALKMTEFKLHSRLAKQLGINVEELLLSSGTTEKDLIDVIQRCNIDPSIHGILVLLPLPNYLNQHTVLSSIVSSKEMEGLNEKKDRKSLFKGKQISVIAALIKVMESVQFDMFNQKCVFLSDDSTLKYNAVIQKLLEKAVSLQIPVTAVSMESENVREITKQADLLAVSLQTPEVVDEKYIKNGAIVIDFNPIMMGLKYSEKQQAMIPVMKGSLNVDSVLAKAKYVMPAMGGIGPVALSSLMRNFLHNYRTAVKE